MADALDDLTRLALFEAWNERCVWCHRPLYFNDMEVEHLLPKSRASKDNTELFERHGVHSGFALQGLENLAPSCGPCNRGKGKRPPPEAPLVASMLRTAKEREPAIRATAEKLRGRRQITRAITVLREGAERGNEAAVAALRETAEQVSLEFREATGREVQRLHSLERLRSVGEILALRDSHFFYSATIHEADGPAAPTTPGSVMSVHETSGDVTSRIDVVPRDEEALERYGPQFTLSPSEGETGERAARLLGDALREGRSVEIGEGIDVMIEWMPRAFNGLVGERLTGGTVKLEPAEPSERRAIPDWDALMRAATEHGTKSLRVLLRQAEQPPHGWQDVMVGHFGGLTVTAAMRWLGSHGEIRWNLTHRRDGSPVREQLTALEFLAALSDGGEVVILDRGASNRPEARIAVSPIDMRPEGRALLAFLTDLRELENWAGVEFRLPDDIRGEDARDIAMLANMVRDGGRPVTWREASFVIPDKSVDQVRRGDVMSIEHTASAWVLGQLVELGRLQQELPAYEVVSIEPVLGQPGYVEVHVKPPDAEAAAIRERLVKRATPTRKPPPPPKRAARERKKKKRKRHR